MKKSLSSQARLTQIITILKKHHLTKGVDPVKLREILEDLGPTFVKIGQIMSSREDLFSARYCNELKKLRDEVAPLEYDVIKEVIEREYGCNINEIFQEINKTPLGSASIAQVHKAILKDGKEVVVKVQRPYIYEKMERDISLIRRAGKILKLNKALGNVVDLDIVLDEFWLTSKEEMDFSIESNYAIRFKEAYKDIKYLYTPMIYRDLSTSKVLVMEYIGGANIDEEKTLLNDGYDLSEIAVKLANNYITQIVDDGFFHADPHCGNIKINEGKICWIDFGMMGTLSQNDRLLLNKGLKAIAKNDSNQVCDVILTLGNHDDNIVYPQFLNDMETFMQKYLTTDLVNINLASLIQDIFNICHKHHISMPKGITMLARGLVTFESTLTILDNNCNVLSIAATHVANDQKINLGEEVKKGGSKAIEVASKAVDIPIQLADVLKMAKYGQIKINLDLMDSKEPLHQIDGMINRLVVVIFAAALLMGSSLICTTDMEPKFFGIPLIGFIGYVGAIIMGLWLFYKMMKIHQKK